MISIFIRTQCQFPGVHQSCHDLLGQIIGDDHMEMEGGGSVEEQRLQHEASFTGFRGRPNYHRQVVLLNFDIKNTSAAKILMSKISFL